MFTTYVAVTALAAAANAAAAAFDFARSELVIGNMATLGIPQAWLFPLGALKAAGALGLLAGIGVPLLGVAAAAGLVLFFVGAVIIHVHAGAYRSIPYPGAFLLLAVGSLALRAEPFGCGSRPGPIDVRRSRTVSRNLTLVALLAAAAGFVLQMVAGVTNTPTIPPGLVVLLAAAALVAFTSWRWALLVGVAAAVFNLLAFVIVGAVDRLFDVTPAIGFIGAWVMVVALIAVCVAGTLGTVRANR